MTFFDCPQVDVWMNDGSDYAGFVQVMEGHTSDADQMRDVMRRYADEMHALRPEIIGATIALHGDGSRSALQSLDEPMTAGALPA